MSLRTAEAKALAGVEPSAPPLIPIPLCAQCGENPRAGKGALSRCLRCIRLEAQRDRDARAAAEAALTAKRQVLPEKLCRTCKSTKPVTAYAKHRLAKDGLRKDCKVCVSSGRAKSTSTPKKRAFDRETRKQPHRMLANLASVARWQGRNAQAMAASRAVDRAVKSGQITQPTTCQVKHCRKRRGGQPASGLRSDEP